MISADDLHLFNEGTHGRLYRKLGAHPGEEGGRGGVRFAVWAPEARAVAVIGDFNGWEAGAHPLAPRGGSGIWEGFVPGVGPGALYKFSIQPPGAGRALVKSDPMGFRHESPPRTASVVWDLAYRWDDREWMKQRRERQALDAPMSIYELHLGSWRRVPAEGNRSLGYREIAPLLAAHVRDLGFTHVELLPVMEHPFFGSWGYQATGYFAPSSRFGTPQDFMFLVDHLHRAGIGVILDWVPSHFPGDEYALARFDGTHLYEHADPRQGIHPDWNSAIFNYGRHEVRSFLLSSALFWLDLYHADALRVDGVASMLYLDYSRKAGEWIPNRHGGRENLEAIDFLRRMNQDVYQAYPDVQTIAEESTSWPMVSRPVWLGGLGFGLKWDMGWMHDTLAYFARDPIHRKHHHEQLTFRALYQNSENFVLPLSHDEVVHGKKSLLGKMPGDGWQRRANLRLLLAWQWVNPGKKLLFMGAELGNLAEWDHDGSLEWERLADPDHEGIRRWVADLNRLYRSTPALYALDFEPRGFAWIDCNDRDHSVLACLRRGPADDDLLVCALNFTPVPRAGYRIGLPAPGFWSEALNSDAPLYGGSGQGNLGGKLAEPLPCHGRAWSIELTLPPLAALFLRPGARA